VLRQLADIIVRPPFILFERSWQFGEAPEDWKQANVTPIFGNAKEDDTGNYMPVRLTLILGKMEQNILETISKHMKDRKVIGFSQHGLLTGVDWSGG